MQLELPLPMTLDELAQGLHEHCAWCKTRFYYYDGEFERHRGPNGRFYCTESHALAAQRAA